MPLATEEHIIPDPQAFWSACVVPRVILIERISSRDKTGFKLRAQQMLDDELAAMHRAMCSLRTRQNALRPITSLPAELLVRIFEFCAVMRRPASPYNRRRLGWIEVTHVCRLWRDTALQACSLWSNICFTLGLQWTEVMLSRAKAAPIIIRQDASLASQSSLDLMSKYIPHARELSLAGPMSVLTSIISTLPCLSETLRIIKLRPVYANITAVATMNFELPGAIVGCRLPSLRRLVLRAFWIPWSAPIFCGLTHLEVRLHRPRNAADDGYLNSSQEEIFCALKNMPGLEILILQYCFPPGPWKDGGSDVLQLPRLGFLMLEGSSAACFGIPKRLHIPPSCQVHISCRDHTTDISGILPFLTVHANASADLPPWHTFAIETTANNFLHLQMWRRCNALEETAELYPDGEEADLDISSDIPELPFGPLKALCRALPLQTIVTFCADTCSDPEVQDWIDILGQCKEVKAVSISGDPAPTSFCMALGMTTDCRPVAGLQTCAQENMFLGKLAIVALFGVNFRIWQPEDNTDTSQCLFVRSLAERQRVKPIPKLDLRLWDCSIKEWVEDLRKVAIFDWDEDKGR